MARKATGQLLERRGRRGITYAARVRAYGKRHYTVLGRSWEGFTRERAEEEIQNILADVRRGIWVPPEPSRTPEPDRDPTLHEFASQWYAEHQREWSDATKVDYRWRLSDYLLPFFADYSLSQIDVASVDRYKAERLAEGRLGPSSINKTLILLSAILESAEERELIARNPARGKRRRLKVRQPRRTYLDTATQTGALLDAATELDAEAQDHRQIEKRLVPRHALLATLVFSGVRIGELLDLRWRDVDLGSGRLRIKLQVIGDEAKTDAGHRDVKLLPALRDILAELRPLDADPKRYVFATARGGRQHESNVRQRVLGKAIERANERLAESREPPLPEGITPHSLRRTHASILYALGWSPAEVMAQLGHTHPGLALRIYAQAMRLDEAEKDRLRALVEGSDWAQMGTNPAERTEQQEVESVSRDAENPAAAGSPSKAADGIRTHDLLHGKQTL
jgi:integrase